MKVMCLKRWMKGSRIYEAGEVYDEEDAHAERLLRDDKLFVRYAEPEAIMPPVPSAPDIERRAVVVPSRHKMVKAPERAKAQKKRRR